MDNGNKKGVQVEDNKKILNEKINVV